MNMVSAISVRTVYSWKEVCSFLGMRRTQVNGHVYKNRLVKRYRDPYPFDQKDLNDFILLLNNGGASGPDPRQRKKAKAVGAVAMLALILCLPAFAADIKIIVSGQSNAVGYAMGATKPDANVLAFNPAMACFQLAQDPLPFWENRAIEAPGLDRGAWITMGKLLLKSYDHVLLTGAGHGGEPISYWDVGQPGWDALSANILKSGTDAQYLIWAQGDGDRDAIVAGTLDWPAKFANLAARIRALCGNPNLPVLVCQSTLATAQQVRDAQYA